MKIIIAGATGLIGKALVKRLMGKHELVIITRNVPEAQRIFGTIGIHFADWHQPPSHLAGMMKNSDALINLAGLGIGDARWTFKRKQAIVGSRVQSVEMLIKLLKAAEIQLEVVIQASAVGLYGLKSESICNENSPQGEGFLAEVTAMWEKSAAGFSEVSNRLVLIRSGVVFSGEGGVLPKMAKPFRYFAGGKLGSGNQWISWIDIEDEVNAILFLLQKKSSIGAYNLVAPQAIQQKKLAKKIGNHLHRPSWIPVPGFVLRLMFGQMANELLLNGTIALPQKLLNEGFKFSFSTIDESLAERL